MVALEQLEEGGLGAGGALAAQQLQGGNAVLHLLQIHQQLVHPQGGPLAHRHQLGRLKVGEAQGGQGLVLPGKPGQVVQHPHQLVAHQLQGLPHQNDVGVIPYIAAGGAQMDDGHGLGAGISVGMDVGHHVVAELFLIFRRLVVVDVVNMGGQFVHLLLGDGQAQLHLGPGQGHPQAAPGGELLIRREHILHLVAGIAGGQRTLISVVTHRHNLFSSSVKIQRD